jgi:hypothetical protein
VAIDSSHSCSLVREEEASKAYVQGEFTLVSFREDGYPYCNGGEIAYIADIEVREFTAEPGGRAIPFQLIGITSTIETGNLSASELGRNVVRGFDFSCVQCWIESPEDPCCVNFISDIARQLADCSQFLLNPRPSVYVKTTSLLRRLQKYSDRGFTMVGLSMGEERCVLFKSSSTPPIGQPNKF